MFHLIWYTFRFCRRDVLDFAASEPQVLLASPGLSAPLIITGLPRSGSTLLQNLLAQVSVAPFQVACMTDDQPL